MSDDQEQDEVTSEPADAGHAAAGAAASRMPGVQAAMNAMAGRGLNGVLGDHAARIGEDLISRLGIDAATATSRSFDVTKMAGLESISERVSTAAKSWMTSAGGAHGALAAAAAFKFDDGVVGRSLGARTAMNAMTGPNLNDILGNDRFGADLIGRYPGLDAVKGYEFTKLAGMSAGLESISERVSTAAKSWMTSAGGAQGALGAAAAFKFDGINPMPGVQAAMNALAGPGLSGVLGNDRFGADLIGRYPGLTPSRATNSPSWQAWTRTGSPAGWRPRPRRRSSSTTG